MLKYLDYLFVIRPALMPPVWTILLLGHHRSALISKESNLPGLILLLVTFLVGAVYILNQIFDIESDRLNQKLFFLAQGYIPKISALFEMILFNLISIIPAFLISRELGILFVLGMVFGFLYSVPPFSFKNRPIAGFMLNALAHGNLAFLLGWCMNQSLSMQALYSSLPYMFAVGAIYLNTTIPDIDGDRRVGKITLAVRWRKEKVLVLTTLLVATAIVLSILVKDIPFLFASSLSLPFFIYSAFTKKERAIVLATKVSILLLSIGAVIFYPWYFAILILGFVGTRLYYKARFDLDYPTILK
jgi:4-hydroxybenzoate polyprenyltransferase